MENPSLDSLTSNLVSVIIALKTAELRASDEKQRRCLRDVTTSIDPIFRKLISAAVSQWIKTHSHHSESLIRFLITSYHGYRKTGAITLRHRFAYMDQEERSDPAELKELIDYLSSKGI